MPGLLLAALTFVGAYLSATLAFTYQNKNYARHHRERIFKSVSAEPPGIHRSRDV